MGNKPVSMITSNGKAFLYENRVHKLFLSWEYAIPNQHVIELVCGNCRLKNVTTSLVDTAGKYFCLSYDFIDGTHEPKDLRQFENIFLALDDLHKNGYVHGDVQLKNMLFTEDKKNWIPNRL